MRCRRDSLLLLPAISHCIVILARPEHTPTTHTHTFYPSCTILHVGIRERLRFYTCKTCDCVKIGGRFPFKPLAMALFHCPFPKKELQVSYGTARSGEKKNLILTLPACFFSFCFFLLFFSLSRRTAHIVSYSSTVRVVEASCCSAKSSAERAVPYQTVPVYFAAALSGGWTWDE